MAPTLDPDPGPVTTEQLPPPSKSWIALGIFAPFAAAAAGFLVLVGEVDQDDDYAGLAVILLAVVAYVAGVVASLVWAVIKDREHKRAHPDHPPVPESAMNRAALTFAGILIPPGLLVAIAVVVNVAGG